MSKANLVPSLMNGMDRRLTRVRSAIAVTPRYVAAATTSRYRRIPLYPTRKLE